MLKGWMAQNSSAGEEARTLGGARALVQACVSREPPRVSRVGGTVFEVGLAERSCSDHPHGFPYGEGKALWDLLLPGTRIDS